MAHSHRWGAHRAQYPPLGMGSELGFRFTHLPVSVLFRTRQQNWEFPQPGGSQRDQWGTRVEHDSLNCELEKFERGRGHNQPATHLPRYSFHSQVVSGYTGSGGISLFPSSPYLRYRIGHLPWEGDVCVSMSDTNFGQESRQMDITPSVG